jgi:HAD superfamily hydrolase (TIGR01544 family)
MIHIENKELFEKKLLQIKKGGANSFHVIADFDRTLTEPGEKGEKGSSSYDPINKGITSEEFKKKEKEMFDYYYPIEISNTISQKEKDKAMEEWWDKYFSLAIKCGLDKKQMDKIIFESQMLWRKDIKEFFKILEESNIPLLIFSAGVGNMIDGQLRKNNFLTNNVHIVSNFFEFDKEGKGASHTKPCIHTFNKNESHIKSQDYKNEVLKRKNVILLGDSVGDLTMADGMEHDTVIKIGFLNHKDEKKEEIYNKSFDVVIKNEGMENINKLLKKILY